MNYLYLIVIYKGIKCAYFINLIVYYFCFLLQLIHSQFVELVSQNTKINRQPWQATTFFFYFGWLLLSSLL